MTSLADATDLLALFGEPARVRLLALLEGDEMSVAELVAATDIAQSRVSTHLGKLRDAAIVRDRRAGTSTFYALSDRMPNEAKRLWELLRGTVDDALLAGDRARRDANRLSTRLPRDVAGEMERHYSPGRTWEALARSLALMNTLGDVLDVGAGDGAVSSLLAPRARTVTCLDEDARMIAAAEKRLAGVRGARVVRGDMHALPFDDASFDRVLLFNVLVHANDPARAIAEAARVLRPHGEVAIVTLDAHEHDDVRDHWQHARRGIAPSALRRHFQRASLETLFCETTSRERRPPHLSVVTAIARKNKKES